MGKASSNKKIARAARAGGGRVSTGQPRSLTFSGLIALVLILGVSLVVFAKHQRSDKDLGGVPQIGDHIHEAIGFDVCGEFLANVPTFESNVGIHTHGDGVLHIHPFSELGVGSNATLGRFMENARESTDHLKLNISNTKLTYLGQTVQEGKTKCKGVKDPELRLAYWPDVQSSTDTKPEVTSGAFDKFLINHDGGGITVFYGGAKDDIPKPPNASQLATLGSADSSQTPDTNGNTTTSTVASSLPTTATTAAGTDTSSTTAPAGSSTTAAP